MIRHGLQDSGSWAILTRYGPCAYDLPCFFCDISGRVWGTDVQQRL